MIAERFMFSLRYETYIFIVFINYVTAFILFIYW